MKKQALEAHTNNLNKHTQHCSIIYCE